MEYSGGENWEGCYQHPNISGPAKGALMLKVWMGLPGQVDSRGVWEASGAARGVAAGGFQL